MGLGESAKHPMLTVSIGAGFTGPCPGWSLGGSVLSSVRGIGLVNGPERSFESLGACTADGGKWKAVQKENFTQPRINTLLHRDPIALDTVGHPGQIQAQQQCDVKAALKLDPRLVQAAVVEQYVAVDGGDQGGRVNHYASGLGLLNA